jgi:hypothetical protein
VVVALFVVMMSDLVERDVDFGEGAVEAQALVMLPELEHHLEVEAWLMQQCQ